MWRDRDRYRDHQYVPDTFWLLVAALLFAACGLVWLIGQVAAILFGTHEHLPVQLVDMLGVLLRLPGTWDDPAKAWPASYPLCRSRRAPPPLGPSRSALAAVELGLLYEQRWRRGDAVRVRALFQLAIDSGLRRQHPWPRSISGA